MGSQGRSRNAEKLKIHQQVLDSSSSDSKLTTMGKDANQHLGNAKLLSPLKSYLVVLVSILFCFIAARNSITWHCQRFWVASAYFWQTQWDKFLDIFGEDPFTLWFYGPSLLTFLLYWIIGGTYTLLDVINKPVFLRKYKVQPGTNEPVDTQQLLKAVRCVLFNQTVVGIPLGIVFYQIMEHRGFPDIRKLPTFHWMLFEIAVYAIFEEIAFYYSHRVLHNKHVYKYIHKQHHEWTAPIGITAVYCHPVEHVFSNVVPAFLGIILMGSHVATAFLWFSIVIFSTITDHSGYHLPFLKSPEFHDFHHLKFNQCYGVLGILDRLHDTDSNFRETRSFTRHTTLLNFVSAREAFPDVNHHKHNSRKQ